MTQRPELSTPVYLILGMHRSGTSLIGRLMESVGFDLGDNLLEGIDSINDRGFWEDREVVALDEHILALYGTTWYDFERLPGKWWEEAKIKNLIGVAETWYQEGFSHEKPIAVKDPRFCRLLPFWKRVFLGLGIRPHVIFVVRHPAEVAASLRRRDGFSLQVGYLLWLSYVIDGLYYSRNLDLSLIDYENLLSNPGKTVARLMQDDLSILHQKSEAEMVELVKKTLDVGSRHQKMKEVLSESEVQGDVQALAHELYDELVSANSEQAKALADKYRKRFYRFLDHHQEVLGALQATVHQQVEANQKLTEIGNSHSYALSVIREKDAQLAENKEIIENNLAEIPTTENDQRILSELRDTILQDESRIKELEQSLSDNVQYIAKCEDRIREQDLGQAENRGYIARCEARITEQDQMRDEQARQVLANHEVIQQLNRRTEDQDRWLTENKEYIGRCEARIKEQDQGLAENKSYIERCEARVREQDNGLHIRDQMLGERLDRIEQQKTRMLELEQLLSSREQETVEAKASAAQTRDEFGQYKDASERQLKENRQSLEEKQERLRLCDLYIADQTRVLETLEKASSERAVALAASQQEVQQGHDENVRLDGELSAARQQVFQHEQQVVEQGDAISALTRDLRASQSALTTTERKLRQAHEDVSQRDQRIVAMTQQSARQVERIVQLEAGVNDRDQVLSERDASIDHLEQLNAGLQQQLQSALNHIQSLEKTNASLKLSGQAQEAAIATLQQRIGHLEQTDTLNKQRILLQKQQMDGVKAHAAALDTEHIALHAQILSAQQELARYRSYRVVRLIDKITDRDG